LRARCFKLDRAYVGKRMSVQLNHTIVWCRDKEKSAIFLKEILGLGEPRSFGPFRVLDLSNGVSLDFHEVHGDVTMQHYAFLISEQEFDEIFGRIRERGLQYWADPWKGRPGEIYRHNGGRGLYFEDPNGHYLEILTRPYAGTP
jgi:catechol 2,3-dioxygenase-like lactoylglutathione lyase family enzyme